ncbi:hypothetical protein QTP88_003513 [Uroleucon formosanum]
MFTVQKIVCLKRILCKTVFEQDPPVGQPVLSLEKRHYTIGDTLKGNCTSPPSSPPSNVTWYLNDKWVRKPNLIYLCRCWEKISTHGGGQWLKCL